GYRGLPRRYGLQLPHSVRGVQGRRARRDEQDARGRPVRQSRPLTSGAPPGLPGIIGRRQPQGGPYEISLTYRSHTSRVIRLASSWHALATMASGSVSHSTTSPSASMVTTVPSARNVAAKPALTKNR